MNNGNTATARRPVELVPARPALDPKAVEAVLLNGDLSKLTTEQRVSYYNHVCETLGLNPLTQPFAYLSLSGKTVLYARKDATEQLRNIHNISIDPKAFTREVIEGVYVVTAPASMPNGRTDVSTGAVAIEGVKGEARANAMMKAETKAKRRVTLSICGLGLLDETEIDSIPTVVTVSVEPPEGYDPWLATLQGVADEGEAALKAAWTASASEFRRHLTSTDKAKWESLKASAAAVGATV